MHLDGTFEDELAQRFAPTYISSAGEDRYLVKMERSFKPRIGLGYPPWKPCIYYSVSKYQPRDDQDFYEINYLSIWDRDTGGLIGLFRPHQWDTERTAILVKGPAGGDNSSLFVAEEAYYAAHEGESLNSSEYVVPLKEDRGVTVYWSLGKHSSYSSYPPLYMALVDQIKQPETRVEPPDYALKNAGTISSPTDLAPWLNYKDNWGPDKVSSVYSKLKEPLWSPKPGSSGWFQGRPGTIKSQTELMHLQAALGLPENGILDPVLFAKLCVLSPELVRNATMMDESLLSDVMNLKPMKMRPFQIGSLLKENVTLESIIAPKLVAGKIESTIMAKAISLGQLPDSNIILYGLFLPDEKKIFDLRIASVSTITKRKIASSDLKRLSWGEVTKKNCD